MALQEDTVCAVWIGLHTYLVFQVIDPVAECDSCVRHGLGQFNLLGFERVACRRLSTLHVQPPGMSSLDESIIHKNGLEWRVVGGAGLLLREHCVRKGRKVFPGGDEGKAPDFVG
jgi:hypothetical protein